MATATMGSPMTRDEALAWCVEILDDWPAGPDAAPHHVPSGWEWKHWPNRWCLSAVDGSDQIIEAHYNDALNIRDLNSIGGFQACGVSADIGQRVRVETDVHVGLTGTLAGVYGDQIWIVDVSGHGGGMTVFRANEITGFARVTDRDEFITRAVDVMFKGNPAMSKHVARSNAVSMWNAGARFTDQGGE